MHARINSSRDYYSIGSLSIYLILSFLFFGRGLLGHFSTIHIGVSEDPSLMMWFLVWWPHAIGTGLNPMLTDAIWAPMGIDLAWETALPLISLIATPLTYSVGPVATLNILCLIAPALSAWTGFLLCRYITKQYWPSLIGGYIFGFSPFILGHMTYAHLTIVWACLIPLICYFPLQRFNGDITSRRFIILLTCSLIAQFLTSHELFATITLFSGLSMLLALGFTSGELRRRVWNLIQYVVIAWSLALALVSPYIYYFLAYGFQRTPHWLGSNLSADALNFLVPAPSNEIGLLSFFESISGRFNTGFLGETTAYIGWPLLVIAAVFAHKQWREPKAKLLVYNLAIILVFSLGPRLIFGGAGTRIGLPWALFQVPILNNAGTARFMIYASLDLAIITALWLNESRFSRSMKLGVAVLTIVSLLPNLSAGFWVSPAQNIPFFSSGVFKRYLSKNETVLILPYGMRGESMYWQAQTHMYFRMAQGASHAPGDFNVWPILSGLEMQSFVPNAPAQFRAFLNSQGVTAVIVIDRVYEQWRPLMSTLHIEPKALAGVHLYRLAASAPISPQASLLEMRTDYDTRRFEGIIIGAQNYLAHGGTLSALTARNAVELGIIPADSLIGPAEPYPFIRDPQHNWFRSPDFQYGVALFAYGDNQIAIGEMAWDPAVRDLIAKYRPIANRVEIEMPDSAGFGATPVYSLGRFVMVFDRQQLERAAVLAAVSRNGPGSAQNDYYLKPDSDLQSKLRCLPMLAFSPAEQTQSQLLMAYDCDQLSRAAAIARPREPTADMPSNRGRAVTSRQPRSRAMHSVIYLSWFNREDSRDERRCVRRGARTVSHVDG